MADSTNTPSTAAHRPNPPGDGPATSDTLASLAALCAIARFHQITADPATLAHQLGLCGSDSFGVAELLHATQYRGLKAKLTRTTATAREDGKSQVSVGSSNVMQHFLKRILSPVLLVALLLTGCGKVDISWTEDVALQDGTLLVVKRSAQGKKLGEIGGSGGWENTQMTLEIESPKAASNPPIWSERWVPMLLDYDAQAKEWLVVATFYTCTDWYDLGRPKSPYIAYRTNGGRWEQVPLSPELFGRKANLLTGPRSGGEPKRITLEEKRLRSSGTAEKYKKVLDTWSTAC